MERWCNEADIKWAVERELKKGTQVRNEEMCRERSAGRLRPSCRSWLRPAAGAAGRARASVPQTTHSLRMAPRITPTLPTTTGPLVATKPEPPSPEPPMGPRPTDGALACCKRSRPHLLLLFAAAFDENVWWGRGWGLI